MVNTDYLIIGQGVSGTFLSHYLMEAGKKVKVIDKYKPDTASRVASGVINPVTGRRIVPTWMIDTLLPFAEKAYEQIGEVIDEKVAVVVPILTFHTTEQMSNAWHERLTGGDDYMRKCDNNDQWQEYFNYYFGVGVTEPAMVISLNTLLKKWSAYLLSKEILYNDQFEIEQLSVSKTGVEYKGLHAKKVIFCDGVEGVNSPFFKNLPFAPSKGEAITVEIKGLPENNIYKHGMNLVPLGDEKFWVGSSFQWDFEDDKPTETFRSNVEQLLKKWLKLPYTIIEHKASVRPGSLERRPFVGLHPIHKNVGILNGMGTKGCSLAPYFAKQLTDHLLYNKAIEPAANISRFKRILMKE